MSESEEIAQIHCLRAGLSISTESTGPILAEVVDPPSWSEGLPGGIGTSASGTSTFASPSAALRGGACDGVMEHHLALRQQRQHSRARCEHWRVRRGHADADLPDEDLGAEVLPPVAAGSGPRWEQVTQHDPVPGTFGLSAV